MPSVEILSETEVTIPNLAQVFKRAFFSTSIDSDGDLLVQSEGPRIIVRIDAEKKLLVFMVMVRIKESAPESAKLSLVNNLNNKMVLARFGVPRADIMVSDCTLPFEEGIPTFQIVATLRLFARVVVGAVRAHDENNIVL
jgi:hypothetical protein